MALDVDAPQSSRGILLVLALLVVAVTFLFAQSLVTVLVSVVVVAVIIMAIIIVGGRLWDSFRHGKPLYRGGARKNQQKGGDE